MLKPEQITVIVDSREQTPWKITRFKTITKGLKTGDYSVVGLEDSLSLERKSMTDFISCIGNQRKRFDNEISRLQSFKSKGIIVECSLDYLLSGLGRWGGKSMNHNVIMGAILGWMDKGIPILFAKDRNEAATWAEHWIWIHANRAYRLKKSHSS
jgi:ERCC4-type nuclease